jgi:putative sigma-54 modulation protein
MQFHFTARKFKAHATLREKASEAVNRLPKYYDGIVRGDVVLGYERPSNSIKWAEVSIHVHGTVLTATEKSEDFAKSLDLAMAKLERQLTKYKSKVRLKNKKTLRKVKESSVSDDHGE